MKNNIFEKIIIMSLKFIFKRRNIADIFSMIMISLMIGQQLFLGNIIVIIWYIYPCDEINFIY